MSLKDQIAQMMMVAAWSNQGNEHVVQIEELILKYRIGGLIFFQGTPLKQAYLTNYYQQLSKTPLMIGIDGEWGLAMRLKPLNKFPFQMTLGAAGDKDLIYNTGLAMGKQCRQMGIHVNFAPDIDVNTNPENPIIGFRSFGENPKLVAEYGALMMKGMQDAGIMACAKHFPGHGDSKADSHLELPFIGHNKERLENVELYPFQALFKEGVMSTMVGHLEIPALDTGKHRPSSLSKSVVTGLLQKDMEFRGLIFTDALNMKGVTKYFQPGYAELEAFLAGNDILLFPENVPKAIEMIYNEVVSGRIDSSAISSRVKKILHFKMLSGLNNYKPVNTKNLLESLDNGAADKIIAEVAEKGITVVNDLGGRLPLPKHTVKKVALWCIGKNGKYPLSREIQKYQKCQTFFTNRDSGYSVFGVMADSLSRNFDEVIISIHDWNLWGKKSQYIPQAIVQNIYYIEERRPTTVLIFGNIYLLKNLPKLNCVVVAYEDHHAFQSAAAQILYGEKPSLGKLPATVYKGYEYNQGISTAAILNNPFEAISSIEAGFEKSFESELNLLLEKTRKLGAAPGGQVLVLKDGKMVYNHAWGNFEYNDNHKVESSDLYDLASITKVAATTISVMKLYDMGLLKLDAPVYAYLPDLKGKSIGSLTLRSLLLHESGLPAWIPFYKDASTVEGLYSNVNDSLHTLRVSANKWMNAAYREVMWQKIVSLEPEKKPDYLYSDLNMMIVARIVERIGKMPLDAFASKHFFEPMHLQRTLFNPYLRYSTDQIAPTVEDHYFRNEKIQGYVHDPAAAMLGGVSGHAGLFSNATELAVLFQMLLNKGEWNEKQYLKSSTIKEFTKAGHRKTHRGLGFDKPNGQHGNKANISGMVPESLFGHTGFTGNWVWADPENDLVFIFLSNRTFPDENNKKLIYENIRTQAIEIVYKSLRE